MIELPMKHFDFSEPESRMFSTSDSPRRYYLTKAS